MKYWKSTLAAITLTAFVGVGFHAPTANALNAAGCRLVHNGWNLPARAIFVYLSWYNYPVASNNLAVMLMRGLGGWRNHRKANRLLQSAFTENINAAAFNLVGQINPLQKLPDTYFREMVEALETIIERGDIPARVLLAERLYFVKTRSVVPNRERRIIQLLERAAETGDADYVDKLARTLYDQFRTLPFNGKVKSSNAQLGRRAIGWAKQLVDSDDPRGAVLLSELRLNSRHVAELSSPYLSSREGLEWLAIAAKQASSMPLNVSCYYSNKFALKLVREHRTNSDDPALRKSIAAFPALAAKLEECQSASPGRPQLPRPFGSPALYVRKLEHNDGNVRFNPSNSAAYLGALHARGLGVGRDLEKARKYLTQSTGADRSRFATEELKVWFPG